MKTQARALVLAIGAISISSLAGAADLTAPMYTKAPPAPLVQPFDWSGFYVGINGGVVWSQDSLTHSPIFATPAPFASLAVDTAAETAAASPTLRSSRAALGAHVGFNVQKGYFVYGIEADADYIGARASTTGVFPFPSTLPGGAIGPPTLTFPSTSSVQTNWQATVRGRLGFATGNWLFFGTGGLAIAETSVNQTLGTLVVGSNFTSAFSDTRVGFVVGGGIEYGFARNWLLRLEYLHADYGRISGASVGAVPAAVIGNLTCTAGGAGVVGPATITGCTLSDRLQTDLVRVGLTYKFDALGPVMAKY
jgi:opacity protein-like surface antigen